MKAKALNTFADYEKKRIYTIGEQIEITKERFEFFNSVSLYPLLERLEEEIEVKETIEIETEEIEEVVEVKEIKKKKK